MDITLDRVIRLEDVLGKIAITYSKNASGLTNHTYDNLRAIILGNLNLSKLYIKQGNIEEASLKFNKAKIQLSELMKVIDR